MTSNTSCLKLQKQQQLAKSYLSTRTMGALIRINRTLFSSNSLRNITVLTKSKSDKIHIETSAPKNVERDWIGPPDKDSNIRPVKIYVPENETELQKRLRKLREETMQFNNYFWRAHNKEFFQQKEFFVKTKLANKEMKEGSSKDVSPKLTPEEMSVFYRKFLNDHYRRNLQYNGEWYRRNFSIFTLTFKVHLEKIKLTILDAFMKKK